MLTLKGVFFKYDIISFIKTCTIAQFVGNHYVLRYPSSKINISIGHFCFSYLNIHHFCLSGVKQKGLSEVPTAQFV